MSEDNNKNENRKKTSGNNNLKKRKNRSWLLTLFVATVFVSGLMSSVSSYLVQSINLPLAILTLLFIIAFGIILDIIGIAVAVADETPFHAMASSKVRGAKYAIRMIKNASKIATVCNDVVGDICSVISGSASAFIALRISQMFTSIDVAVSGIVVGALAAGLTVLGKGLGKTLAISKSTEIVFQVAKIQYYMNHGFGKNKN